MDALLDGIELQTGDTPRFAVIWIHGLGADGSDFVPVVPHLGLDDAPSIRFVFPNAPQIPVSCNGGYVMPAWYDIISLAPNAREVDAGTSAACPASAFSSPASRKAVRLPTQPR